MGGRGCHRIVVEFTTTYAITIKVVSSNPFHGKVYSMQHYVIKFVNDLREVGSFLRVLRFSPLIKLTAMPDTTEILLKVALNNITLTSTTDPIDYK